MKETMNVETMVAENGTEVTVENKQPIELSKVIEGYHAEVQEGKVLSNIEYVTQVLNKKCEELENTVYSGEKKDQLAMIKSDRHEVNNFKDMVTKQKASVKKALLIPFEDFEKAANKAINQAQRTYDDLNKRAAAIEEEFRQEKRIALREFFDTIKEPIGDYADEFYQLIFQDSWANASTSLPKTKKEIQEKVDSYVTGMDTLDVMLCEDDIKESAVALFKKNLDIAAAMQYIATESKERAEAKAREEARIAAEKARIEAEAQAKIEEERRRAEEEKQAAIEAEKRRAEAERQAAIEEERRRVEEEKQAELRAERERLEKEAAEREAAAREAARLEAIQREREAEEKRKAAEAEKAISVNCQIDSTVKVARDNSRICVEFLSEDWKAVKEYCELHEIFYSVK